MSVQRERSQRMDVLTTLLLGLMAFHGEIPQPELDQACEEREAALDHSEGESLREGGKKYFRLSDWALLGYTRRPAPMGE